MSIEKIAEKFKVPLEKVKEINNYFAMSIYSPYVENFAMALPSDAEERALALTYDHVEEFGVKYG